MEMLLVLFDITEGTSGRLLFIAAHQTQITVGIGVVAIDLEVGFEELGTSGNGTIHIALGVFSNAMLFVADKIVEL